MTAAEVGRTGGHVLARQVFRAELDSLAAIRRFVEKHAAEVMLDEDRTFRIQLAVCEACANAIEHAKLKGDICAPLLDQQFSVGDQIDLKATTGLGQSYETSTIAHRLYEVGGLPSEGEAIADLEAVLSCYDAYLVGHAEPSGDQAPEQRFWLFQANPAIWDLEAALKEVEIGAKEDWKISRYRSEVRKGDEVALWQSGNRAGLYGFGQILTEPMQQPVADAKAKGRPAGATEWRVDISYTRILDEPVPRRLFLDHPVLSHMSVIRAPEGTNHKLSGEEWRAILRLVEEDPLVDPLARVFASREEADWALEFVRKAAERLGVTGPDDPRITLSLRYRGRGLHFSFGNWYVLGFYAPGFRTYRACLPALFQGSAFPAEAVNATFAQPTGETKISLYTFSMEAARSLSANQEREYLACLDLIADRFEDYSRSPFRRAHVPELAAAVFDHCYRDELMLYGLAGKPKSPYTVAECAKDTGFTVEKINRWLSGIGRKKQAIIYGPPGTGKTFVAERLARILTSGGSGRTELVQFHPAYAYEDFIQGIRPVLGEEGGLTYDLVPGTFLSFCAKAGETEDTSVLIIDEVNRANLSRVFGELMYLLEYRDKEIPLAGGGTLHIPENVRIIGTMNTADRSIALVDHALRRRFAFIALYPDWDVLRKYHERHDTGFAIERLVVLLAKLNKEIGDPHYAVGVSFFMRANLGDVIENIWGMEIEPYLEEYFFDQESVVDRFRWGSISSDLGL